MGGESERQIAAIPLIACFLIFTVSGTLFAGRTMWKWQIGQTQNYLRWERGIIILALLVNVFGIVLLEDMLHAAGDYFISPLALAAYLLGAAVLLVAETTFLHNREWVYPQIILHVVIAFLAQAAFGAALLQTGLVPSWVGWATILWNVGWLVILTVFRPRDIYFPVLHHVAPLIIGIALLVKV